MLFASISMLSHGEIAQLVEQSAHIRSVEGPSPPLAKVLVSTRTFFSNAM